MFFGKPKVQEAYNIINFQFLMENSILKKLYIKSDFELGMPIKSILGHCCVKA